MGSGTWNAVSTMEPRDFTCGYCGRWVGADAGYSDGTKPQQKRIYICPFCSSPTFFKHPTGPGVPGPLCGGTVGHLPKDVASLYEEARRCMSASSPTAAVMVCRKILMHVAVDHDAAEGLKFAQYVEWLDANRHITAKAKPWVDHIRRTANEANHEIRIMSPEEGKRLITFVEMLLKNAYELPGMAPKPEPSPADESPAEGSGA